MDKITYLAELAEGLARWVPERERQDILRYYAEYFDEAGPERVAEVIQELGDPWALSCRLAVEGGFVTQEAANSWTPPKRRKEWPIVLTGAGIVAIVAIVAVASLASNVGRLVGSLVAGRDPQLNQAAVIEETDFADVGLIPQDEQVAYIGDAVMLEGFWTMEDGYLEAFDSIDVDVSLGNVMVTNGEDYTLFIQQSSGLGGYRLDWAVKNGTLRVRDGSDGGRNVGLEELVNIFGKKSVDVVITIPDVEHLDRLTVKTKLGDVYLSKLFVEGSVSAESGTGDVECYEVQTMNKLKLSADVGDVMLNIERLYEGMEMELESDVGTVEAGLGCRETECSYELETDVGTVCINGRDCSTKAERKSNTAAYRLDVESDVGDVNVYFREG